MAKRTTVQSSECQNIVYNLVSEKEKKNNNHKTFHM